MLIYNNCQDFIVDFRKHGALDSQLPLREDDAMKIMKRPIARRIAREFQWGFCPYTFPENMSACHCNIEQNMILPFIDAKHIGSGAFGDVDKMTISPSQQNFDREAKTVQVVRKRLKATGETEEFKREDTCLRLLNQLNHPNIIPLLGSYTYLDEHNFLFPYFDMDLGSFLKAKTRHQDFQWDSTFYSALTGLASALSSTHHLILNQEHHDIDFEAIGYHHDLRPPNVLVRSDTFVLADFGLGRLKQVEDPSHTPYKWTSGDYVAPENTDGQENPQTANRATDVWAFGCLLAEVVTYMLTEAEGLERFRQNRLTPGRLHHWKDSRFYQPDGHVKKEVIDWMEALKSDNPHPDCAPLLVELALDVLQADPQHRPDMRTIYQRLKLVNMKKHFHTVQDKLREIRGSVETSEPHFRHHLGSLRYAQERFELWGNTLTLGESKISVSAQEQSERYVEIMKELLQTLREEPGRRHLGDESVLLPFASLIIQPVEELWKLLPTRLLQSAENQWEQKVMESGFLPAASMANLVNPLKSEFEEEARKFKDSLDDAVPFSEILKVKSINDVYDITDKIQRNGLRNLPEIRIYLQRLSGYADLVNDIIDGSDDVLVLLWGSIAILLQLAEPLDKAFDSLLSTIAEVGKALPDFGVSASIFNQNMEAKEILILFFKDLLNFYGAALKFFSHPSKTVLSSAIIDQLRDIQGTKTAFAFLTYQEAKTSAISTIHSLVFQLAERDEDLMAIVCESIDESLRSDLNAAANLLSSLIHYAGLVYLVIDGVNEISEAERGRLVTELLRLVRECENLRIILSARPEADLTRLLCDTAAMIQIHNHNEGSINNYVLQRAQYILGTHNIPLHIKSEIRNLLLPLASRAKGMFLFARLVIYMVETAHDMSELQEELKVLPESLDDA
ncbi:nacht domain-containing protein [Annulohypoxylon truncatum]|uniref:nacht domain-containing protein n=1 Tax=Annulohypoxylon truncatum TaxID=327061 RepID=UPI002008B321|nr:nacht domain-containing protein [Annulohypoxylon truncatum]KAI1212575.1 nacht domain-containing protein [Annulohypoxylon truncatum]